MRQLTISELATISGNGCHQEQRPNCGAPASNCNGGHRKS